MNDILFGNNNKAIIKKITSRELSAEKKRNFFIVSAILLTAFMLTSVFSIGMSYYDTIAMREKRMQGSLSQMAFAHPRDDQLGKIYALDYIDVVGIGAFVAATNDIPGVPECPISYVDQTQWEEMFCPTYTNVVGYYPAKENELMLSRYILDALKIDNAEIGMTIPLSYIIDGNTITEDFVLSCIYTEYSHSRPGSDIEIYCAKAFAERHNALETGNLTVNIIFENDYVAENIERLKVDLPFYENQPYIQSPAFDGAGGDVITYFALGLLILFLMFAGYLLIYNVMYISVSKDVRFFGMLKTVGTTPKQIRRIVTGQVFRLCLIGLPLGCLAAAAVSLLLVPAIIANSGIDTGTVVSFSPVIYIGAILFSLLTAWFGAITPAKKAASISPIEALRYTEGRKNDVIVKYPIKGKPFRMALRNVFRDRKRAAIVMLSLFLSITVFTSVMTIINGIDIDNYINSEYDYDFFFTADMSNNYFLNETFVEKIRQNEGINDTSVTKISSVELRATESLNAYAEWVAGKAGLSSDMVVTDGSFYNTHTIKGIDMVEFNKINATLPNPIDPEGFERGETVIINATEQILSPYFNSISTLEIKRETDVEYQTLDVGGVVTIPNTQADTIFQYSDMEILVSNSFLERYMEQPQILSLGMNVDRTYEEQLYYTVKDLSEQNGVSMASRYEGRKTMQDAKTIMLVLGSGISIILGFIGTFNFINVMSVGVMSRKHELAILESIGMSKKQLRSMLRFEGIWYMAGTLLASTTLGNVIGYGIFRIFKNIVDYAIFSYPVIPMLAVYAAVLIICLVTPELAYHSISRDTLVERLHQN